MMPNELPIPAFPSSDDATAAIALPQVLAYFKEFYCSKVKIDILRYGVEEALARWKLDIERMHTEDWWPPVARARQQQEERNRPSSPLITVSQTQSNREEKIDNRFEPGSNGQVFNGNVEGEFKK